MRRFIVGHDHTNYKYKLKKSVYKSSCASAMHFVTEKTQKFESCYSFITHKYNFKQNCTFKRYSKFAKNNKYPPFINDTNNLSSCYFKIYTKNYECFTKRSRWASLEILIISCFKHKVIHARDVLIFFVLLRKHISWWYNYCSFFLFSHNIFIVYHILYSN